MPLERFVDRAITAIEGDETVVPRYSIVDQDGNVIAQNVALQLENTVTEAGTPLNAETFNAVLDEIQEAIDASNPAASLYVSPTVQIIPGTTKLVEPNTVVGIPVVDASGNPTDQLQVSIEPSGVMTPIIASPSVAPAYFGPAAISVRGDGTGNFRSLADACEAVSGRYLPYNVTITVSATTGPFYGNAELIGIHGPGKLTITGTSSSAKGDIRGALTIRACASQIAVNNLILTNTAVQTEFCNVTACAHVWFDNCVIDGNSCSIAIRCHGGANVHLSYTQFYNANHLVFAEDAARVYVRYGSGLGTVFALAYASTIMTAFTYPGGSTSEGRGGVIRLTGSIDYGTAIPPTPPTTTATYAATDSGWYQVGWKSGETMLRQGYTGSNEITGGMWFNNTTLRSALSGKTILGVTLRLRRMSGYGKASAIKCALVGLSNASKSGSPGRVKSYGQIATLETNNTVHITIPVAVITDLVTGAINALGLYIGDGAVASGHDYSTNYGALTGYTDSTNGPLLTITYK